ncbi:MAG: succinylglutamate desuccinylase/aspartoacylase family protein [Candidatus Nanohaloarchaea archaeon]|nr:succinylglutamate desuccinylase/aspartoacylase family protein [Candidatus Nanohaloarchaea archaeon]
MHSEIIGDGAPDLCVVSCLHGDETGGREAARSVLNDHDRDPTVQYIEANQEAVEEGVRYIDTDLNRAFPGDRSGDAHERRLAAAILKAVRAPVIDLHTTPSTDQPFCVIAGDGPQTPTFCRATGLERVIDIGYESGGLIQHVPGISVECGRRGTDKAVENGVAILQNVLDACSDGGAVPASDPEVYRITGEIERREDMQFLRQDFEPVAEGEVFATAGGEEIIAEEPFYPVLTATDGYEDRLGYTAERAGTLSEYKTVREQGGHHG